MGNVQMPLCARCTGIYTGVFLAFCFFFFKKRMQGNKPFSAKQTLLMALAIIPLAIDGFCSYIGLWESNQLARVLTGGLAGVMIPALFLLAGNFKPAGENEAAIYKNTGEMLILLAVSVAFGLFLWIGLPLYSFAAVISIIGEVCVWAGVVWMLLKTLFASRALPYWRLSFAVVFSVLFCVGGLVP